MKTIAIFGDLPTASTGMAVVLDNLAQELSRWFRVIYFGRFGQEHDFAQETTILDGKYYEYIPTQGGVWDRELVVRALKHYDDIDYIFCEDDWFSGAGIVGACNFWEKPFHFLTPIDAAPVNPLAFNSVFTHCTKLYVPNSSYKKFDGLSRVGDFLTSLGPTLKSIYLPHGVRADVFKPMKVPREDRFTFLVIGRPEERKAIGRAVLAFEKIHKHINADLYIRTDWNTQGGRLLQYYIRKKNLSVIMDQMADVPHSEIAKVYNKADVNICPAKAGGFEMSVTEAAACGLISLVTDWTYMNENVVNGKTGFTIPISGLCHPQMFDSTSPAADRLWGNISIDALSEKMYWCYLNRELVRSMGRYARSYVREVYDWKKIAEKLKNEILSDD